MLPVDKFDTDQAEALVALGFPTVEPILPEILEWIQDMNWPVAQAFYPLLCAVGEPLAPYIRTIFATDDEVWKYWALHVLTDSPVLAQVMHEDLAKLAQKPSSEPDVPEMAQELLNSLSAGPT